MFFLVHTIIDDEVFDKKLSDASGMPRFGINKPCPLWKF